MVTVLRALQELSAAPGRGIGSMAACAALPQERTDQSCKSAHWRQAVQQPRGSQICSDFIPCPSPALPADANKRKMGSTNGIDAVLQAIAPYRNRWGGQGSGTCRQVRSSLLCAAVLAVHLLPREDLLLQVNLRRGGSASVLEH